MKSKLNSHQDYAIIAQASTKPRQQVQILITTGLLTFSTFLFCQVASANPLWNIFHETDDAINIIDGTIKNTSSTVNKLNKFLGVDGNSSQKSKFSLSLL